VFTVSVETTFSASHRLVLADGGMEPPHGHDWRVTARFVGDTLDGTGMLVDFVAARRRLDAIAAELHHTDLNVCAAMQGLNPSAEHVARVIHDRLAGDEALAPFLDEVQVTEAPGCAASYTCRKR
jgi:6-pyruvoyltetrahydropterin/6-carboxytetrahydropterin synthase